MKTKLLLSGFCIILVALFFWSASRWQNRDDSGDGISLSSKSSEKMAISPDLLADTQQVLDVIRNPAQFTHQTCAPFLHQVIDALEQKDPATFDYALARQNHVAIIQNLWSIRLALHDSLRDFVQNDTIKAGSTDDPCVNAMRDAIRTARYMEDFLGEAFLGIRPFDEKKDPKAINTLQGDAPHLLKAPGVETVTIRSGDMIISRGTAYTSAAIARIGTVRSQFSHLAVIYVEDEELGKEFTIPEALNNPHVKVLEAHIEIGSTIRPFKDYVADGNARNALFRYADANVAHEAAKWAHDFLVQHRIDAQKENGGALDDPNNNVPYDFKMNLGDLSEIFCSEMGYIGYRPQGIILPQFPTVLEARNDVVKTMGITKLVNFAPGDLELDTRFQYLAEWRDYRKMHSVRYKDAVLTSMFNWMRDKNYEFHPALLKDGKALVAWLGRQADMSFAKNQLPKNMGMGILRMVFTLDSVGQVLEDELTLQEQKYQASHSGRLLTYPQTLQVLESYRAQDADQYTTYGDDDFHISFHSNDEFQQRR